MEKERAEQIYRWRRAIIDNFDKIKNAIKSSKKAESNPSQLSLFDAGLEVAKETPKIRISNDPVNIIEWVNKETEILGITVLYDPIDELYMYKELYCSHEVYDILELTEKTENIVILDRLVKIDHRISVKGNKYCKLFFYQLGETYIYLWGQNYRNHISSLFINECYLIQLTFNTPTKDFDRYSYVCTHIKNVKDVDINEEYNKLIKNSKYTEMDEHWMIKNRKFIDFSEIKVGNPFRIVEGCCFADFIKKDEFNVRCMGGFHKKYEIGENYEIAIDQKCIRLFTNEDEDRITQISLRNEN